VGSAVNQTARQVGGAFGVALLVVILGAPTGAVAALDSFHHLWWYCAGTAALAGSLCTLLAAGPRGAAAGGATGQDGEHVVALSGLADGDAA
jgi:hypothetical protein